MDALAVAALLLVSTGLVQATLMLVHAWEHSRFYARRAGKRLEARSQPRVALIAPCKGVDPDLRANLRALFRQAYPTYELCFVVESECDPAVPTICELAGENGNVPSRIVVAGAARDCGQKVHNLMCATRAVLEGSPADFVVGGGSDGVNATGRSRIMIEPDPPGPPLLRGGGIRRPEVLAFVDSDACPHPEWLGRLVARLERGKYAVATGYRWYVPAARGWASLLVSAINNTIINMTGPHGFNLVWGGAWAIRTETFLELGLPDAWQGSLSDDLVVSRLIRKAGLRVGYEPHCLVQSKADFNWGSFCEFLRRQFLVVRVYLPLWWCFAFLTGLMTNLCLWGTLLFACYWGATGGPWAVPLVGGMAYYLAGILRASLAAAAVRPFVAVPEEMYDRVARLNVWGWPLVALASWLGVVSAAVGRTIVWRGILYRMNSPRQTTVVHSPEKREHNAQKTTRAA